MSFLDAGDPVAPDYLSGLKVMPSFPAGEVMGCCVSKAVSGGPKKPARSFVTPGMAETIPVFAGGWQAVS
jgi:hypothetical protein